VRYIGEIGEADKADFLGNAAALLFPIDWPEPFGLTMIEAMASGTPVVAWDIASVPEVIDDGVTGFIVSSSTRPWTPCVAFPAWTAGRSGPYSSGASPLTAWRATTS
jgi:glycosyltransferase involved in cell wall biosynthesis